jgi:hypothetical protein
MTRHVKTISCGALLWLALGSSWLQAADPLSSQDVKITDQKDRLRIEIGGQLFSEYVYQGARRPYMYPIIGPGGQAMTRNWPMKSPEGEEHDHPHHKSLWFSHGEVNKVNFWADEGANLGLIVHEKFSKIESGSKEGSFQEAIKWAGPDGKTVCTEDRTVRIGNSDQLRWIDFQITLKASEGDVVLGDTKEGSMGIRLAETMRLTGKTGKGHIVNSVGQRDGNTWGKRAAWCDYYGPVDDKTVGVAFFDHPQNPRYPTTWHVRDYGLFAANPFGLHDFEKKPAGAGDLKIPSGQSVTFRYRLIFHMGNEKDADIAALYREYTK